LREIIWSNSSPFDCEL